MYSGLQWCRPGRAIKGHGGRKLAETEERGGRTLVETQRTLAETDAHS